MADPTFPEALLAWFQARRRVLPWRSERREPYRTWVAETMLQQTRVEAVVPYYTRFLAAFPDVAALAAAEEEEVLRLWAGLGYYRRARFLHRAARQVVADGGALPVDAAGWRELPGVGAYTAAAVASLAHGERVPVVDGNVKRVAARVQALELAADDPALHRAAHAWGEGLMAALPAGADPGALNEALMELGATVCTPRSPACGECPVRAHCAGRERAEDLPAPRKPVEWKDVALTLLLAGGEDRWLLRRRESGWNPGLWEPPSADGRVEARRAWAEAGLPGADSRELGSVRHAITRHRIRARVLYAEAAAPPPAELQDPAAVPLTGLARKALKLAAKAGLAALLALGPAAGTLGAQEDEPIPRRGRPAAHVPTVTEAPRIDGLLLEAVWEQAARVDDFTEVTPVEGGAPEARTEVLLMRDDRYLYVAFICHEPRAGEIVLQNMTRDAFLARDDHVIVTLDTFRDRRNGYFFQVSAAGSRGDALVGDAGKRFNKPWDGFWRARTRVLGDRWIAEMAIPFATLAFGDQGIWGANFRRVRGPGRATYQWSSPRRETFVGNVRYAGDLTGFAGVPHPLGVELRPYGKATFVDERGTDADLLGTGGGEISWRVTPRLGASLTFNTDFAETEVDERRVNLGRFPLFFPEKRDFFLEDATLFDFGEQGSFSSSGRDLLPYFSRRIGLLQGEEVPIDYGMRVAGRAGRWDLGLLGVHVGEAPGGLAPEDDLLVFRPSFRATEDLAVGALVTSGDPSGAGDNTAVGSDLRWSTDDGLPGTLAVNAFAVWTDDEALGGGLGGGVQADLRTGDWTFRGSALGAGADFRPALGFVRRPGEVLYSAGVDYSAQVNQGRVRTLGFGVAPSIWRTLDGRTSSHALDVDLLDVEFEDGDSLALGASLEGDNPDSGFTVADGATVAAGDYDWVDGSLSWSWSSTRPLSGSVTLRGGDWYDGSLYGFSGDVVWRPSMRTRAQLEYLEDRGSISGGDFTVRVERLRLDYAFTTDLGWQNLVQADNQSDSLGLQSRLHWVLEDGRELFVVLGADWRELEDGSIVAEEQDFIVKLVYAVRF